MGQEKRTMRGAHARRGGFTLIELLVVMSIILALVALTASASMRFIAIQKGSVTQATITKVDSALRKQWEAVVTAARREDITSKFGSAANTSILAAAGNDPRRARVIYIKLRLKQEFPINFKEAVSDPAPLGSKQSYKAYLAGYGITNTNAPTTPATSESAACLLMALREGRSGGAASADDFGATSVDTVVIDNSTLPLPVLVDGWRRPLAFYRWPTDNTEVDGLGPPSTLLVRDPEDPDGLLVTPSWWNSQRTTFQNWCHALYKPNQPNTRYACYTIPVIASWGPNGKPGLQNFTTAPAPNAMTPDPGPAAADANDNIYNYRLQRLGARGD
jgi:prepilin-type N-terminal cleavage/methylation domain-containing protein